METNCKRFLVIWTFMQVIPNLVLGLETFSPLNINIDNDAKIAVCHFTKTKEPTPGILGICGFKGETCSIDVKKNQSKTHEEKEVKCDCLDQVLNDIDEAYHNIPAPDYSFATNGDTGFGHDVIMYGARVKISSGRIYVELDGVNDYIDLGNNSNNCLGNVELCPAGLTLSMWVWPTKLDSETQWYFAPSAAGEVGLTMRLKNQILQFVLLTTSHRWRSQSYQPTGKWTLITVTWIENGVLSVYIDGCLFEAVGSIVWPGSLVSHRTVIGKRLSWDDNYAGIKFDEFMFWEKVLEPAEVMTVYISDY